MAGYPSVVVYHSCLPCFQPGAGVALGKTKGASAGASGEEGIAQGVPGPSWSRELVAQCGVDAVMVWKLL